MKKKLDLSHLSLPLGLIFLGLLVWERGNSVVEFELVIVASIFYLSLAFIHHHFDKTLTFEVIIEYILIDLLALIILQGLFV